MKLPLAFFSLISVLILLTAAGCGGGDDDDDDDDAQDEEAPDEDEEVSAEDSITDEEAAAQAEEEAEDITSGSDTATIARAVVQVFTLVESGEGYEAVGWGSGTIIDPGGLILTNNHVIDPSIGYDEIGIGVLEETDRPPEPAYFAEVLITDAVEDLAVLQITKDNENNDIDPKDLELNSVALGDPEELEIGDELRVIGYPGIGSDIDADPLSITITVTEGRVSGFINDPELDENRGLIKTDAIISPGNSGGAAFNDDGELIGVPTFFNLNPDEATQTLNGIRPIFLALDQIEAAKSGDIDEEDQQFVCTTCEEEEDPVEGEQIEDIIDQDTSDIAPEFGNFSFSTGVDDAGAAVDSVETVPSGLGTFYVFVDYSGMVDGLSWAWYCYDPNRRDFGSKNPSVLQWSFGESGTIYFTCYTEDASPLPSGEYEIVVVIYPEGVGETPVANTFVTVE